MWNCDSVEGQTFNQTTGSGSEFNSSNAYCDILASDPACDGAVAAPDIQYRCAGWNPGGKKLGENTNASAKYGSPVSALQK
jgi:hypothetical protein